MLKQYKSNLETRVSVSHMSTVPVVGVGKERCPRYWNYLEDYWPCAGEPFAANAIGMQVGDPINSGLIRWRLTV